MHTTSARMTEALVKAQEPMNSGSALSPTVPSLQLIPGGSLLSTVASDLTGLKRRSRLDGHGPNRGWVHQEVQWMVGRFITVACISTSSPRCETISSLILRATSERPTAGGKAGGAASRLGLSTTIVDPLHLLGWIPTKHLRAGCQGLSLACQIVA